MKPTTRRTRKPADVAWGFFFTSDIGNGRVLVANKTKALAVDYRLRFPEKYNPSPIFRITPPAEIRKPRKKVNRGR